MKRVVVTGIGALTPIGNNLNAFLEGLQNGKSGANHITHFDASKFKTQFACEVNDFKVGDFMDRREARRMDIFSQYALVSAQEALQDSGLEAILDNIDKDQAGVIWASGIGGLTSLEKEIATFAVGDGTPRYNPFMIPKMIS